MKSYTRRLYPFSTKSKTIWAINEANQAETPNTLITGIAILKQEQEGSYVWLARIMNGASVPECVVNSIKQDMFTASTKLTTIQYIQLEH